jgi:hypothetical protein
MRGAHRPVARLPLGASFHIFPEAQLSAAWARVPVAGGRASAPNVALHGMVGVGYRF